MPEIQKEILTPEQISELEALGFDKPVITLLNEVGFTIQTMKDISKWGILVNMLKQFVSNYKGADPAIRQGDGGGYSLQGKCITLPIDDSIHGQHYAVIVLAHEVTHALSQVPPDNASELKYAEYLVLMEGEAYYNTIMA